MKAIAILSIISSFSGARAWTVTRVSGTSLKTSNSALKASVQSTGSLHGQNACFLPLEQFDEESYAPRIIQIAGAYPGLTKEEFFAVTSEPAAERGQWAYDFSDPDGPQMGTVAVRGCEIISTCVDPVAIICEHFALGVPLPEVLKDPVDILAIVDRAKNTFLERKFLVVDVPGEGVVIGAYPTKADMPEAATIIGQVVFVQLPWLPCMKKQKSGWGEEDELY